MLQAHSLLWHYLWVAPNVFLLALAFLIWRRSLARQFPAFLAFAVLSSIGQLATYVADIAPWVSAANFWRVDWATLVVESLLKFFVIAEIFSRLFHTYASISKVGRILLRGLGGILVLIAVVAAAYSRGDSTERLVAGEHLTEQTTFIIESGLIVFLFMFAAYFRLNWDHQSFGVLLGLGISSCVHLASWAVMTNASPSAHQRVLFDFLNMATYQVCVLMWFYYLLVPHKAPAPTPVPALPENNLDVWNRELERLLQQ